MKNQKDLDSIIDNLLARQNLTSRDSFAEETLLRIKSTPADKKIDELLGRLIAFDSPNFVERVIAATFGVRKKIAARVKMLISVGTFAAAASIALVIARSANSSGNIPTVDDYEKITSIMNEINNISYLVFEEAQLEIIRF